MKHLTIRAARRANLNASDWVINGAGRYVSHAFGFGLLDPHKMVKLSREWKRSPAHEVSSVSAPRSEKAIPSNGTPLLRLYVECRTVRYMEHTIPNITLEAMSRDDVNIRLTSPSGTKSSLLTTRPFDDSPRGFNRWLFMTVHDWVENPNGMWSLEIQNKGSHRNMATLKEWILSLFGTVEDPDA